LPFRENITTIVNNKAINVIGLIFGMNLFSYHSRPLAFCSAKRVSIPAMNGMPRYMKTLLAISAMEMSTSTARRPNQRGTVARKKYE